MKCTTIPQNRCKYSNNLHGPDFEYCCRTTCRGFRPYVPDLNIYDASVIKTVDTLEDLYSINIKHMPDGKIVKVLNGPEGLPVLYFYDRELKSWIETNYAVWSVIGGNTP